MIWGAIASKGGGRTAILKGGVDVDMDVQLKRPAVDVVEGSGKSLKMAENQLNMCTGVVLVPVHQIDAAMQWKSGRVEGWKEGNNDDSLSCSVSAALHRAERAPSLRSTLTESG